MNKTYTIICCNVLIIILISLLVIGIALDIKKGNKSENKWKHLNYKGHSYIFYAPPTYQGGIVHDPDCECKK